MNIVGAIIAYLLIWWVLLFTVLPWGATSAHEAGEEVLPGNEPSAPMVSRMGRKLLITTVLAIPIWGLYFAAVQYDLAPWDILTPDELRGESFLDAQAE
jgi:predicted secreted protein